MRLKRTRAFSDWFESLIVREQAQVDARLHRIEQHNHFGDVRDLGDGLAELRWTNGRRVYFTRAIDQDGSLILLILGGMKNGQKKDLKQARLLVQKYAGH
jgi:putative addiction module killer protein